MVPYINETVAVNLVAAQKNKRKFQALLEAVEDDTLTLTVDDDTLQVKMRDIKSIHLVQDLIRLRWRGSTHEQRNTVGCRSGFK